MTTINKEQDSFSNWQAALAEGGAVSAEDAATILDADRARREDGLDDDGETLARRFDQAASSASVKIDTDSALIGALEAPRAALVSASLCRPGPSRLRGSERAALRAAQTLDMQCNVLRREMESARDELRSARSFAAHFRLLSEHQRDVARTLELLDSTSGDLDDFVKGKASPGHPKEFSFIDAARELEACAPLVEKISAANAAIELTAQERATLTLALRRFYRQLEALPNELAPGPRLGVGPGSSDTASMFRRFADNLNRTLSAASRLLRADPPMRARVSRDGSVLYCSAQ
jgi:hypothetical protein